MIATCSRSQCLTQMESKLKISVLKARANGQDKRTRNGTSFNSIDLKRLKETALYSEMEV